MRASGSALLCRFCRCRASLLRALLAKHRSSDSTAQPASGETGPSQEAAETSAAYTDEGLAEEPLFYSILSEDGCALCGCEPAGWVSLENILEQGPDAFDAPFSGNESDGSRCSENSSATGAAECQIAMAKPLPRSPVQQSSPPRRSAAADACTSLDAAQLLHEPLDSLLAADLSPDEALPKFSDAELQLCLAVADRGSPEDPPLRMASINSSAGERLQQACASTEPLQDQLLLSHASGHLSSDGGQGCAESAGAYHTKKRRVGRPRCYDTTLPLLPGERSSKPSSAPVREVCCPESQQACPGDIT